MYNPNDQKLLFMLKHLERNKRQEREFSRLTRIYGDVHGDKNIIEIQLKRMGYITVKLESVNGRVGYKISVTEKGLKALDIIESETRNAEKNDRQSRLSVWTLIIAVIGIIIGAFGREIIGLILSLY